MDKSLWNKVNIIIDWLIVIAGGIWLFWGIASLSETFWEFLQVFAIIIVYFGFFASAIKSTRLFFFKDKDK